MITNIHFHKQKEKAIDGKLLHVSFTQKEVASCEM
jgi:hypothetical protein